MVDRRHAVQEKSVSFKTFDEHHALLPPVVSADVLIVEVRDDLHAGLAVVVAGKRNRAVVVHQVRLVAVDQVHRSQRPLLAQLSGGFFGVPADVSSLFSWYRPLYLGSLPS